MKCNITEIVELGNPQSIIQRDDNLITELIKTDSLIKELNEQLLLHSVSTRTIDINTCASLIRNMPTDQAIQIMKSNITGQPKTTVIEGDLVVAYVR